MSLVEIKKVIKNEANSSQAKILQRFFKTGKGEYGEGDIFYGIKVPIQRRIAKTYSSLSLSEIKSLLYSPVHEERLIAAFILVDQFKRGDEKQKKVIFDFYINNRKGINNWDLVDLSAPKIVGEFLLERDKAILYKFALSANVWDRRIAILSTFTFISNNQFEDALKISEILLNDRHDLIHKAVGWMLREIGKLNFKVEEEFLIKHYKKMPRTMLRYAIEKFPERKRTAFLKGKI